MVLKYPTSAVASISKQKFKLPAAGSECPGAHFLLLVPYSQQVQSTPEEAIPRVKMCSVSKGKRNVTQKVLQRMNSVSCPHTRKTTCFIQQQCSRRSPHSRQHWDRPLPVGRAVQEAEEGGSTRLFVASEVSAQQRLPASFGAGSRGQRMCLQKGGVSLRPGHLQNFCSRTAYKK